MGFEVFQKSSAPLSRVPAVTIQKNGLFSLNRAAHGLIGEPDFVELLWDAKQRVIGLRPAKEDNPNAFPVRAQSSKTDKGPVLVAGTLFTRHYDIPTHQSRRWVVRADDGILCIDLKQESQVATSNRAGRNAESAAAGA